jgi:thioredoxin-dependent peroxiredoxin
MVPTHTVAPDFKVVTSDGKRITLSEFRGKKNVVLFFYPKDFSPTCTKQACLFRDSYEELREFNCELIGVSYDTSEEHAQFKEAYRLPFHLVSDTDKSLARLYGVARFGGFMSFIKRVTFVIDTEGIIRDVIHHEFIIGNHIQAVRETLRKMQREVKT